MMGKRHIPGNNVNQKSHCNTMPTILLTAAEEDVKPTLEKLSGEGLACLHLSLEIYRPLEDRSKIEEALEELDRFEQVAYGSLRNARFFLEAVRDAGEMETLRGRVNLAVDARTSDWLEEQGIPAIRPQAGESPRAIDLMELLLRLRRTGPTLYPCGRETPEELPGLLRELEMPVEELVLFGNEGPGQERLERYREQLSENPPDAVVFHSRRAVVRTLAAFPGLDLEKAAVVSADRGITGKLEEREIAADMEASGSWESIAGLLSRNRPL